MAGICVLHNDPTRASRAFQAFDVREPEPFEFGASRRARLWELSPNLHCSIVGTCLTAAELRQVFVRLGDADARTASDHALHGRGVRAASRRDDGGKALGKALDKRHEGAIRRFGKADTTARLRELWRESLDHGDVAGPYWALLTHPLADSELVQDVFGDVHMLSHQVGAAARLDIARLRRLEAELGERDEKIARQQARLAEAAAERAAARETIARLEARLAAREVSAAVADIDVSAMASARRELAEEAARATALASKWAASEARRGRRAGGPRGGRARAARTRRARGGADALRDIAGKRRISARRPAALRRRPSATGRSTPGLRRRARRRVDGPRRRRRGQFGAVAGAREPSRRGLFSR
jgi:hypothetical protein